MTSLLQQISTQAALLSTDVPGLSQLVVQNTLTEVVTETTLTDQDDENEAYSPSRSFTPPPPSESGNYNLPDTSSISLPSNLQVCNFGSQVLSILSICNTQKQFVEIHIVASEHKACICKNIKVENPVLLYLVSIIYHERCCFCRFMLCALTR